MSFSYKSRLVLLLAFLLPLFEANATRMRPMEIEEMTGKSDVVLQGKVTTTTVQRDPSGRIYTKIILQVIDVWKGKVATNQFTIVKGGGILGGEQQTISGDIEYVPGEEVVAFLVLNDRGEGVTLGLAQGKFKVETDPETKEKVAHNIFHGTAVLENSTAQAKAKSGRLAVSALKQRVQGGGK